MKRKRIMAALLCLLLVVQALTLFCVTATAAGETATISGVLEDLQRDPDFKVEDYPENPDDHSVRVIQVAEGVNGELFVYVYRPEGTTNAAHRADSINMSLINPAEHSQDLFDKGDPQNHRYYLTWLNSNGTLEKYKVNDFVVSSDEYRYYNIAAVYRPFDESVDVKEDKSWDDITGYKGYEVGLCWQFWYYNDVLVNEAKKVEVVDFDINVVGFVRYDDGWGRFNECTDAHYVGFSVANYDVTRIFDADVTFARQSKKVAWSSAGIVEEFGEKQDAETIFISDQETGSNAADGWFSHEYTWERIVTKEEFVKQILQAKNESSFEDAVENNITDDKEQEDPWANVQYVFQFLETDYTLYPNSNYEVSTYITDVGILRLHFQTPEGTYNLGVVGDLVSDDGNPDIIVDALDNLQNNVEDMWEMLKKILAVVLLIFSLVVLWPFIHPIVSSVFKFVWSAIKWFFKLIWKILTWPFKLIGRLLFPKKE